MTKERIFKDLFSAVVSLDEEKGVRAANELIKEKLDPLEGIEKGLSEGMKVIGEKFDKLEVFLPELLMAADVFNSTMEVLGPEILIRGKKVEKKGTVVIGTVKGDIHEIGKDIVAMLLETAGFAVHNLGKDISVSTFLEQAKQLKADIIAMSSLLTTTMLAQKELIDILKAEKKRDKYIIMIGGAPTSQAWADEIGADGYGKTAKDAVSLALKLVSQKREEERDG